MEKRKEKGVITRAGVVLAVILLALSSCWVPVRSQESWPVGVSYPGEEQLPRLALKTNMLYLLTGTPNLGLEARLSARLSAGLSAGYNPWTFGGNAKLKHVLLVPELRYWFSEPFNGAFAGVRGIYADFNAGHVKLPLGMLPGLADYRYRGQAYGGGVTAGYAWILSPRWNLEAWLGAGFLYTRYDKYECRTCGAYIGSADRRYWGPTGAGISLVYILW
jgi:hypothetical protein